MADNEIGTFSGSLRLLAQKGIRYSTVIDVGCADGHFFLSHLEGGVLHGATPLNVDSNALYETSLQAIKTVVGGHYRISAISDHRGEVDMTMAAHPYWSSVRPEGDLYWQRLNQLTAEKVRVPVTTLDTLRSELSLKPPFLLKMDIQGAEMAALRGATDVLKDTHAIICETDLDDFHEINAYLAEAGFVLFDATQLSRLTDGTLGWFYPVYVNRSIAHVLPKNFWDATSNDAVIQMQIERRTAILKYNAEALVRLQNARKSTPFAAGPQRAPGQPGRNQPCTCGSGKKFKHCCGQHTQ